MWYTVLYDAPSPSGKAEDFDSSIRRFKSGRPNHAPMENDAAKLVCGVLPGGFFCGKAARHTLRGRAFPVKKVHKKPFRSY